MAGKCDITLDEMKPALRAHRKRNGITIGCQSNAHYQHGGRNLCFHHYQRALRQEASDGR